MANNRVQVKRTSTSGRTPNTTGSYATNSQYISAGELALNMADGILYTSNGSAVIEIGANNVNQRITNSISIDNNKSLRFQTVNTSAYVGLRQQSDDNFVLYTTNTAYGERAVWSIFANSVTSNVSFSVPAHFNANVGIATGAAIYANGGPGTSGQVLSSNGSAVYWATPGAASVNVSAQYNWTNLHTFSANVSFTGNGIGLTSNTGAIYLGGLSDANWKIGRNTGVLTKWRYTNNTIDVVTANSSLEGFSIGLVSNATYFETGYLGTYIAANVTIGNSSSNSTINSTAFSGSANNTSYLNGQLASYYTNATNITTGTLPYAQIPANVINTTAAFTISGVHTYNANIILGSSGLSANGGFGTAGQVLHSNGTATYWAADDNSGGTVTSVATGNGMTGGPVTTTGTVSVLANTGIVANSTGVFVNATYIATLSANNTTYVNGKTEGNLNVNSALNSNNSSYLGGTIASSYQLNSTLNANIASYLPTYTGVVNGSSHTVGTSTIANSTGVYTGVVNATTISTGSVNVINSSGLTTTANVSIGAAGDLVIAAGAGIYANGELGTTGQVLTSNASSIYWSTVSSSVNTAAQYNWTNTHTFNSNTTVGNATFANTFLNSYTGISNPQSLTAGVLQTNASLNTLLVGPYTISSGNSLIITTGSRVVVI